MQRTIGVTFKDQTTNQIQLYGLSDAACLLVFLPAMGVRAAYYHTFARQLTEGSDHLMIALTDLRGQGHSSVRASRRTDWGYVEMLEDLDTSIDILQRKLPGKDIVLGGHSLGGQLACLYQSRYPGKIDGLILIACCSVYYRGWEGVEAWKVWLSTHLIFIISRIWGYFPGHQLGFGGREARTEIRDWWKNAHTGKYLPAGSDWDYEQSLQNAAPKILAFSIKYDNFAPASACTILLDKFSSSAAIDHQIIDAGGDRGKPLNHFNWAKHPEHLRQRVESWMKVNLKRNKIE